MPRLCTTSWDPLLKVSFVEMVRAHRLTISLPGDLTFKKGAMIRVLRSDPDQGWWQGECAGQVGLFPANFVQVMHRPSADSQIGNATWLPENGEEPLRLHLAAGDTIQQAAAPRTMVDQ